MDPQDRCCSRFCLRFTCSVFQNMMMFALSRTGFHSKVFYFSCLSKRKMCACAFYIACTNRHLQPNWSVVPISKHTCFIYPCFMIPFVGLLLLLLILSVCASFPVICHQSLTHLSCRLGHFCTLINIFCVLLLVCAVCHNSISTKFFFRVCLLFDSLRKFLPFCQNWAI